jgi:glycosyl transferase family 87
MPRLIRSPAGPVVLGAVLMGAGIALRWPVFDYAGPRRQVPFNQYVFDHSWAAYSDIASLFFRDGLWRHPIPYFDYRLEYPVVTGAFVYAVNGLARGATAYFVASAAVLAGLGAATIALIRRVPGSNVWLLAVSPAIVLYSAMNWDWLALLPTVGALILYLRGRDGWAGALLAVATGAKLFPALLLPFALLVAVLERRFRAAAAGAAAFVLVTLAINLPVALQSSGGGGLVIRKGWAWFYKFNVKRPPEISIYHYVRPSSLGTAGINRVSGIALVVGLIALLVVTARRFRREQSRAVLVPAFATALLVFFFVNKVYSPQYSLWVMALLALRGAPLWLAGAFAAVDLVTTYVGFHQFAVHGQPAHHDYITGVLNPAGAVREVAIAAVLALFASGLARRDRVARKLKSA